MLTDDSTSLDMEYSNSNQSFSGDYSDRLYVGVLKNVPLGVVLSFCSLLTIVGNAMVLHAVRTDKKLQSVSNMFIVSLAIADLTVGLVVMPISTVYIFTSDWIFGVGLCQFWIGVDYTASTASILNLLVLSLDRFWSVTKPLKYLSKRTKKRALCMISMVWVVSSLWIVPIVGWHHFFNGGVREVAANVCETEYATNTILKITTSILNFFLPLGIMYALYTKIFLEIRKRSKLEVGRRVQFSNRRPSAREDEDGDSCTPYSHIDQNSPSRYGPKKSEQSLSQSGDEEDVDGSSQRESVMMSEASPKSPSANNRTSMETCLNEIKSVKIRKDGYSLVNSTVSDGSLSLSFFAQARAGAGEGAGAEGAIRRDCSDGSESLGTTFINCGMNHSWTIGSNGSDERRLFNGTPAKDTGIDIDERRERNNQDGGSVELTDSDEPQRVKANQSLSVDWSSQSGSADDETLNRPSNRTQSLPSLYVIENTYLTNSADDNMSKSCNAADRDNCLDHVTFLDNMAEDKSSSSCYSKEYHPSKNYKIRQQTDPVILSSQDSKLRTRTGEQNDHQFGNGDLLRNGGHLRNGRHLGTDGIRGNEQGYDGSSKSSVVTLSMRNLQQTIFRFTKRQQSRDLVDDGSLGFVNNRQANKDETYLNVPTSGNGSAKDGKVSRRNKRKSVCGGNSPSSLLKNEIKAARQLGVIMGVFTVCFLPYFVCFTVVAFCDWCVHSNLMTSVTWIGYLNSTLNPFLYPLCNVHFRRKFRTMLQFGRRLRRFAPPGYDAPATIHSNPAIVVSAPTGLY